MSRYKVTLSYNGTFFSGSQYQPGLRTVISSVKDVLVELYHGDVPMYFSGRTDQGVHAAGQVFHYDVESGIPLDKQLSAFNSLLPDDISVLSVEQVSDDFHARFSAVSREYRYLFSPHSVPFYLTDFIVSIPFFPNELLFDLVSSAIVGRKNFDTFRSAGCGSNATERTVFNVRLKKKTIDLLYSSSQFEYYEFKITANAFFYRMVRRLMGAVFKVLNGAVDIADFEMMFTKESPAYIYQVAPAKGLCLTKVSYE